MMSLRHYAGAALDSDEQVVVAGNTEFALALYKELRDLEGNLFFSPYSISTALAMTYAGARRGTEAQMRETLHFPQDREQVHQAFAQLEARFRDIASKGQVHLAVANALWPHTGYPLLKEFLTLVREHYGVQITSVDYGDPERARATINSWVADKTANRIRDLIPPGILDALTRLVLVNAIYFKGSWASQFDPDVTREAPFWIAPRRERLVPMMNQRAWLRYWEGDGLQVLELPYAGRELSMVVLLPENRDGLPCLEDGLSVESIGLWTQNLWRSQVEVSLPRFEVTLPFRLDATLAEMGMVDAFGEADFSGMDGTKQLYIAAVLHKAFVAVNEVGTEAAAATAVVMATRGLVLATPVFCADHPFLFLIRDNRTGSILFLGRVVDPGATGS